MMSLTNFDPRKKGGDYIQFCAIKSQHKRRSYKNFQGLDNLNQSGLAYG